jgi:hypothetical protein
LLQEIAKRLNKRETIIKENPTSNLRQTTEDQSLIYSVYKYLNQEEGYQIMSTLDILFTAVKSILFNKERNFFFFDFFKKKKESSNEDPWTLESSCCSFVGNFTIRS